MEGKIGDEFEALRFVVGDLKFEVREDEKEKEELDVHVA